VPATAVEQNFAAITTFQRRSSRLSDGARLRYLFIFSITGPPAMSACVRQVVETDRHVMTARLIENDAGS